jgi:hypothetical protein
MLGDDEFENRVAQVLQALVVLARAREFIDIAAMGQRLRQQRAVAKPDPQASLEPALRIGVCGLAEQPDQLARPRRSWR